MAGSRGNRFTPQGTFSRPSSGWLCLTDEPVPGGLRAAVDDPGTDERAHAMDALP
ncbi:hypothetical protein ABZ565_04465 [Streptomyces sp. NPDC016469]|uniref:hypothetical protein n=1 Tax=Streptomyces sp. NPDC016469 TaxID=3157191 RepID=UPI0033CA1E47